MASVLPRNQVAAIDLVSSGLTTAATAYTSGDVLGVQMSAPIGQFNGFIRGVVCADDSAVIAAHDLYLFGASVTPAADNAAFAPSDAEIQSLVGLISLSTAVTHAANKALVFTGEVPLATPGGTLYVVAVTRSANAVFAGGATSLRWKLYLEARA